MSCFKTDRTEHWAFHLRVGVATVALAVGAAVTPAAGANLDGDLLRNDPNYGLYNAETDGDTLVWPAGTYDLGEDGTLGFAFVLGDPNSPDSRRPRTNLTIDATGVTILVTDPNIGVFSITGCHGITIKGLTIDYDPIPWSQSTVTAVDEVEGTFCVSLDPSFISLDDPGFDDGFRLGTLFDPVTRLAKIAHVFIDSAQDCGGGNWKLTLDPKKDPSEALDEMEVNDLYLQGLISNIGIAIGGCEPTVSNPHPVTLDGVTMYATAGIALALSACPTFSDTGQARLLNCNIIKPTPDDGRLATTHGGGFIISSCRVGPVIDNCTVQYTLDDALNMNGKARRFESYVQGGGVPQATFLQADFSAGPFWNIGDRLQLLNPVTGAVVYRDVVNIQLLAANLYGPIRVTFDAFTPGMISDGTETGSTNGFNMNAACSGFDVRNSTWGKNRRHGAVLGGSGTYRRNVVEDTAGIGIIGGNFYVWNSTGPAPENLIIRNNTVENCGRYFDAAIRVGSFKYDADELRATADFQSADAVVVEGNAIENWGTTYGIHLAAAKNSWILPWNGGNPHDQTFLGSYTAADRAIFIGYPTGSTSIEGVDATGSSGLDYAITIENGVDADVTVDLSKVHVTPPTQKLEDLR